VFSFFRRYDTDSPYADPARLQGLIAGDEPGLLVDVRTVEEYASGHIPGALSIPVAEIQVRPPAAAPDDLIVVYCHSGARSTSAKKILTLSGFTNVVNFGAIKRWTGDLAFGEAVS